MSSYSTILISPITIRVLLVSVSWRTLTNIGTNVDSVQWPRWPIFPHFGE